jgi:hypothetical protein
MQQGRRRSKLTLVNIQQLQEMQKKSKGSSSKRGISHSILNEIKNVLRIWKADNKAHKPF